MFHNLPHFPAPPKRFGVMRLLSPDPLPMAGSNGISSMQKPLESLLP